MKTFSAITAAAMAVLLGATAVGAATTSPPSITTGAVTSVTPSSVVVNGTVDPNGLATTFKFEYGLSTSGGFSSATPATSAGAGKAAVAEAVKLSGLTAASSYQYRIKATNAEGTTYGATGIFDTNSAPTANTSGATSISATSATLNGIVNPEALSTKWYFEYGRTTSYGAHTPVKTLPASPNNTNVSAVISGLLTGTTYDFRLIAESSAGKIYGTNFALTTGLPVTINASETSVVYGGSAVLSGTVTSGAPNVPVTIQDELFNQTAYTGLTTVTSGAGGAWSFTVQPSARTTYRASVSDGVSSPFVLGVRPAVALTINRAGTLTTRVVASSSFADHVLQLQRLMSGLWVTWKHVRLNANGVATFATSLPTGRTAVRMAIAPFVTGVDQAAPGYLAGFSSPKTYVKK